MPEFRELEDPSAVEERWLGTVTVVVEGPLDEQVFGEKFFFDRGDELRFEAAGGADGSGGCLAVCERVASLRHDSVRAFGLVDRDAWLREGNFKAMLEPDDEVFRRDHQLAPWVEVLCRWELENYLLIDPQAVADAFAHLYPKAVVRRRSREEMLEKLLECCEVLIPVAASRFVSQQRREPHFRRSDDPNHDTRARMRDAALAHLARHAREEPTAPEDWGEELDEYVARIEVFAEDTTGNSLERLDRLSRIIDGKCIRSRLNRLEGLDQKEAVLVRELARRTREHGSIDAELTELVDRFAAAVE